MISNVIDALANVVAVAGLAPHKVPPNALNTADLPAGIIVHRGGEYTWHAIGLPKYKTRYDIMLVIEPAGQSRVPELVREAQSRYETLVSLLLNDATLGGAIDQTSMIRDSYGYHVINVAGIDYFGYTLTVEVIEK